MSRYTTKQRRLQLIEEMLNYYNLHDVSVNTLGNIGYQPYRKKSKRKQLKRIRNKGIPSKLKGIFNESAYNETVYAEYVFDTNTINLNESVLSDNNEFLVTILHEIKHAIDGRDMGIDNFKADYFREMDSYESRSMDGYVNNKYEISAENFANSELSKWTNS